MSKVRNKIYHLRTSSENKPPIDVIEQGEIAMSYSHSNPTLYIKDSENQIVTFPSEGAINNIIDDKTKDFLTEHQDLSNLITDEQFASVEDKANNSIQKNSLATINGESIENGGNIEIDLALYKLVTELPTENINPNKIYLLPHTVTGDKNVFGEYLYVKDGNNAKWEMLGTLSAEIDLSAYLKTADADKKYMPRGSTTSGSGSSGSALSISTNGSFNNFGNNGQAFNAVRDVSSSNKYQLSTGSGFPLDAASFGIKDNGTTAFSHKKYDTFNKETGAATGAKNTAVLVFSGKSGLLYAKNTGSANDVTDDMYKRVGVIDSPDEAQKVYSASQVDTIISGLTSEINALKKAITDLGGTIS